MSIVTFWNEGKEQSGKTFTAVAIATKMAIERNLKILLLSTAYKDDTVKNCYWIDTIQKRLSGLDIKNNNIAVENGIEGLSKLVSSNKIQPSLITDYTKVILKGRLEVLNGYTGAGDLSEEENQNNYKRVAECYPELIRIANQYYDMVLVDLDNAVPSEIRKQILDMSNVNILVLSQRLETLEQYRIFKTTNKDVMGPKCIPVLGKYDHSSKYNKKNLMRHLEEKKELNTIPYNILFFEAAQEAAVTDFFLKFRTIKETSDPNYIFMDEVGKLVDLIITRLQELQMKMR